ncbi:MAG: D-2-hydroxyacid dehydrogenase [Thaumarchaeota archaeon]|nr:D-2-hydroxyacid dehydrogenase [Nitrososphaerota archaeon]
MGFKALVCDTVAETGLKALKEAGFEVNYKPEISEQDLAETVGDYDVLVVRSRTRVTKEIIDTAKKLKAVGRAGSGVDNIDVKAAQAKGIAVVNSPEALTNGVAELVIGLMISAARGIPKADAAVRRGEWPKQGIMGTELRGKTLGIVGMGKIGLRLAKFANVFDMKILGYDVVKIDEKILAEVGAKIVDLDSLLRESDFVSIHVPLLTETRQMINAYKIGLMKSSAFLINTSRGKVIDENALYETLSQKKIRGAALDVFESEPPVGSKIITLPNVICTPHIGSQTVESQDLTTTLLAEKLIDALKRHG